jgi:hypothetical protein
MASAYEAPMATEIVILSVASLDGTLSPLKLEVNDSSILSTYSPEDTSCNFLGDRVSRDVRTIYPSLSDII